MKALTLADLFTPENSGETYVKIAKYREAEQQIKKLKESNKTEDEQYSEWITRLTKQIKELEELLKIAQCPNNCDDGSIAHGSNETGWEQEQCQFCYERKKVLNQ